MKARLKRLLKDPRWWPLLRYALPMYHRPLLALWLARAAAALFPSPAARARLAAAYVARAKNQIYAEEFAAAAASCEAALAADPSCAEACLQRGHAFMQRSMAEEAIKSYQKGLEIDPRRADLNTCIGHAFMSRFDQPGQVESAVAHYQAAIALDPYDTVPYVQAGMAYRYAGRYDKAEDIWGRSERLQRELAAKRGLDKLGIRFVGHSWLSAIGHVAQLDTYVKMGLLGLRPSQKLVLALPPEKKVPNRALLDYLRPHIDIVADPAEVGLSWQDAELLQDNYWASTFPDGKTRWFVSAAKTIQQRWESEKRPALLRLSDADRARGKDCLKKLGVPEDAWHAGLHVREPGFWRKIDADRPTTRDADIDTYLQAIRSVTSRGGWVIRMGDASMKPLPKMDRVVDYAHSALKSEWLDVYLAAASRFFIATPSGFGFVPAAFGVPCAWTNWSLPGVAPWYGNGIWIPKLFWSKEKNRNAAFDELFAANLASPEYKRQFEARGLTVVDNTAEEIDELVLEMLERVSGEPSYEAGDDARQREFTRIAEAHGAYMAGRLGRAFLRRHAGLLSTDQSASVQTIVCK